MAIDLTTQRLEMLEEEDRAKEKVTIIDLYDESGQSTGTEVRLEIPKIKRKTK